MTLLITLITTLFLGHNGMPYTALFVSNWESVHQSTLLPQVIDSA